MKLKNKQKRLGLQLILAGLLGFLIWVMVFFNITITETTSAFVVNNNTWTTAFVNNLITNHIFYLFVGVIIFGGYFLIYKTTRKRY